MGDGIIEEHDGKFFLKGKELKQGDRLIVLIQNERNGKSLGRWVELPVVESDGMLSLYGADIPIQGIHARFKNNVQCP